MKEVGNSEIYAAFTGFCSTLDKEKGCTLCNPLVRETGLEHVVIHTFLFNLFKTIPDFIGFFKDAVFYEMLFKVELW